MIYILKYICFSFESLQEYFCTLRAIILDLLNCKLHIKTIVSGKINDGHTAFADLFQDFIFSV